MALYSASIWLPRAAAPYENRIIRPLTIVTVCVFLVTTVVCTPLMVDVVVVVAIVPSAFLTNAVLTEIETEPAAARVARPVTGRGGAFSLGST